jgi:hypothetical protein
LEKDRSEDDTMDSEVVFIGTTVYIAPEYLLKGILIFSNQYQLIIIAYMLATYTFHLVDHSLHIVNEHFGVG